MTREHAAFVIQALIIARSHDVSEEAVRLRKEIAQFLESQYPGIIFENYAYILIR